MDSVGCHTSVFPMVSKQFMCKVWPLISNLFPAFVASLFILHLPEADLRHPPMRYQNSFPKAFNHGEHLWLYRRTDCQPNWNKLSLLWMLPVEQRLAYITSINNQTKWLVSNPVRISHQTATSNTRSNLYKSHHVHICLPKIPRSRTPRSMRGEPFRVWSWMPRTQKRHATLIE